MINTFNRNIYFYLFALKKNPGLIKFIPKQAFGFILALFKRIDKTKLKEYFFCFLSGIDTEKTVECFWEKNDNKIFKWYLEQKEADDIIASASPEFLLRPICERLGIKYLVASEVDTASGKFFKENCRGQEKVRRLKDELNVIHADKVYFDSESDIPLAMIADRAFVISNGEIKEWHDSLQSDVAYKS